jgi:hypothetical protein
MNNNNNNNIIMILLSVQEVAGQAVGAQMDNNRQSQLFFCILDSLKQHVSA